MPLRALSRLFVLTSLVLIAACGRTDKFVAPEPVNPFDAAKAGSDTTFEIMTWNIENFAKRGNDSVRWVAEIVEGLEVDVIAVQEIASGVYFDRLVAQLAAWDGVRATSDSYQNLAFLYRSDGPVQLDSVYEILAGYSRAFPRTPYVLECTVGGASYVIINNHYKCCGDGDLDDADSWDEETRRRDANLLLQDYVETNYAGQRVLIVGDLNDKLTDTAPDNVFQNFLDDPVDWRFADMELAQDGSAVWSYPSYNSHLDHILVTGELFANIDAPSTLIQVIPLMNYMTGGWSAYDAYVSDHLPVVMRIQP